MVTTLEFSVKIETHFVNLTHPTLAYATLTVEQLLSIFKLIKTSQTLEDLNIGNNNLEDIPKEMLTPLCKLKIEQRPV